MRLYHEGWGYTKIHKYLLKNGFKIGKSRTESPGRGSRLKNWLKIGQK